MWRQEAHKKTLPTWWPPRSRPKQGQTIELWWQDEARVGQQGSLTYIWGELGTGRGRRATSATTGRIVRCGLPCAWRRRRAGAARANTHAMNLHLREISTQVTPGAHAVLICDGAGWHKTGGGLTVPANISLLHLPPYSPELTWGKSGRGNSRLQCHDFLFSRGSLRSEVRAIRRDAARCRARSNSHTARVNRRGTNIPLAAGMAQAGETILNLGL